MTAPLGTIGRAPLAAPGLEFNKLRDEAIARIQHLSGKIWTDYNYSDPGVTILEQLCYALTELPYRALFDVPTLLSPRHGGRVPLKRHGLFPAWAMLPCAPVTAADLRRVVLDRVPWVANVWFEPQGADEVAGLYDIAVLPRRAHHGNADAHLAAQVARCFVGARPLCEDVRNVHILGRTACVVHADLEIDDDADAAKTLASALFALGMFLAPEPKRIDLDQKCALSPATSDVFAGPPMRNGFIETAELKPMPTTVTAAQLTAVLAATPGVLAVDSVWVDIGDGKRYKDHEPIRVPKNHVFDLATRDPAMLDAIVLRRNASRFRVDPAALFRQLRALWQKQRQTYPLPRQYAERYGAPAANWVDLAQYSSVQDQFPDVYGIGQGGPGPGASAARIAKAQQLRGYLMPFDQLLADAFAQLAFVPDLFSVAAGGKHTYATQSLRGIVPNGDLLRPDYAAGHAEIRRAMDPVDLRRNAVLDLLLSFYALHLNIPRDIWRTASAGAEHAVIGHKQCLLRHAAFATRNRGRGLDYRRRDRLRAAAGVELLSRIELGLVEDLSQLKPDAGAPAPGQAHSVVDAPDESTFGTPLDAAVSARVARDGRGLGDMPNRYDDDAAAQAPSPLAGHRIHNRLHARLGDRDSYRLLRSGGRVQLVCLDLDATWWLLGEFDDEAAAIRVHLQIVVAVGRRPRVLGCLHIVEWVLLRYAHGPHSPHAADYGFRITAVTTARHGHLPFAEWRHLASSTLRRNTPSHIALDCLFLDDRQLRRFERLHGAWRKALAHGHGHTNWLRQTSKALERFLARARADARTAMADEEPIAVSPEDDGADPSRADMQADDTQTDDTQAATPTTETPAAEAPAAETPPAPQAEIAADAPAPREASAAVAAPTTLLALLWKWIKLLRAWLRQLRPRKPQSAPASPPPPAAAASAPADQSRQAGRGLPWHRRKRRRDSEAGAPPHSSQVAAATRGAIGLFSETPLDAARAEKLAAAGLAFVVRSLSRNGAHGSDDLTAEETARIRGNGLAVMAIQHAALDGWMPGAELGKRGGEAAAAHAAAAGLPGGTTLWLALNGAARTSPAERRAFANAWHAAVTRSGYTAGFGVAAKAPLSADAELPFAHFWQTDPASQPEADDGFCMARTRDIPQPLRDLDQAALHSIADGEAPPWWAAPTEEES